MRHFRAERRKFRKTKTYIMLKIGFVAIMLSLFVTLSAVGSYFRPSSEFAGQNAAFNTAVFIILENGVKIYISFKTLYPRGKGPTYEPLLCPCLRTTCNFFAYFSGLLSHPQATSTDDGGPRTSDFSVERRGCNHLTTAPPIQIKIFKITLQTYTKRLKHFVTVLFQILLRVDRGVLERREGMWPPGRSVTGRRKVTPGGSFSSSYGCC